MILAADTQNKDVNTGTFNRNTLNQADHKKWLDRERKPDHKNMEK